LSKAEPWRRRRRTASPLRGRADRSGAGAGPPGSPGEPRRPRRTQGPAAAWPAGRRRGPPLRPRLTAVLLRMVPPGMLVVVVGAMNAGSPGACRKS